MLCTPNAGQNILFSMFFQQISWKKQEIWCKIQQKLFFKVYTRTSRIPWSCGIICHVLDQDVGDSNHTAAKFWVKNETTVWKRMIGWKMKQRSGNKQLGEKWNNGLKWLGEKWNNGPKRKIGWKMKQRSETKEWVKNETTEFRKHDSNQGFQVVAPFSNIVKYQHV